MLCRLGGLRQRIYESRVAYTILALALTIILKKCRLSEVNVAGEYGAIEKIDRLGSEQPEQADEVSGHGRRFLASILRLAAERRQVRVMR